MKREAESLDDCTHVAPKGQFKAMNREAELRKGCGRLQRGICKSVSSEPFECNCGNIIKQTLILCPTCQAELKGITETKAEYDKHLEGANKLIALYREQSTQFKQAVQKLKEDKRFKFDDLDKAIIDEILGELTQ